jgi:hypothetical protein
MARAYVRPVICTTRDNAAVTSPYMPIYLEPTIQKCPMACTPCFCGAAAHPPSVCRQWWGVPRTSSRALAGLPLVVCVVRGAAVVVVVVVRRCSGVASSGSAAAARTRCRPAPDSAACLPHQALWPVVAVQHSWSSLVVGWSCRSHLRPQCSAATWPNLGRSGQGCRGKLCRVVAWSDILVRICVRLGRCEEGGGSRPGLRTKGLECSPFRAHTAGRLRSLRV